MVKNKKNLRNNFYFILISIISLSLSAQSCAFNSNRGSGPLGVWGSEDGGENWSKLNNVAEQNKKKKQSLLDNITIRNIVSPIDNSSIIYLASSSGLFGSDNAGNTWYKILAIDVTQVAVARDNTNIIYVTGIENGHGVVYKSLDRGVNWQLKYTDTGLNIPITVALNTRDSFDVFVGFSSGLILNSLDGGLNWSSLSVLNGKIADIKISEVDPRVFYALIKGSGLYYTKDRGKSFVNTSKFFIDRSNKPVYINSSDDMRKSTISSSNMLPSAYLNFEFDITDKNLIYLTTDIGLYSSNDNGNSWKEIRLPIDPRYAKTIAISSTSDPAILYVSVDTILFKSVDNGLTFSTTKIPTERLINKIFVVPNNPNIVYVGMSS